MIDARPFLEAPWLVLTGWSVVIALWSTALAALALAVWRTLRSHSTAQAQYRAALVSLSIALVLSMAGPTVLALAARAGASRPVPGPERVDTTAERVRAVPQATPQVNAAQPDAAAAPSSPRWARAVPAAGLGVLGLLWLVGVAIGLIRLGGGWLVAGRLGARAALVDEGPVRDTFEHAKARIHVEHARLAVSLDVEAPVTVGVTAPTVVVPGLLLERLPPDSLEPILAHELAHVARHDYAVNLAQCVAEALLFHSPATWWIGRRIREAREFCCDDGAVGVAGDRARYVEALTLVARLGTLTGPGPMLGIAGPRLITRVRRLLEGEPTVIHPFARTAAITTLGLLLSIVLFQSYDAASSQLSTRLLAATAQDLRPVPIGFPQRQEGSALRIRRVESSDSHACGTFEVENVSDVRVTQVRLVGILSFRRDAKRPVQIQESDWIETAVAPGATARLAAALIDVAMARREAEGQHVQAFCALREVVHENRAAWWSMTPNAAATTAEDAMGFAGPSLPRSLIGQTSAMVATRMTLCMDEKGAEYSPGAQVAIRDEPGKAARCTPEGQWIEVDRRTGQPLVGNTVASPDEVTLELLVAGQPSAMSLKGTYGSLATMQLPSGQKWGFVPARGDGGDVEVALHDLASNPHRLIGTKRLSPGQTVTFANAEPALSLRLTGQ